MRKRKSVTLTLDAELWDQFHKSCDRSGFPASRVVEIALRGYYNGRMANKDKADVVQTKDLFLQMIDLEGRVAALEQAANEDKPPTTLPSKGPHIIRPGGPATGGPSSIRPPSTVDDDYEQGTEPLTHEEPY